jgi:hypothetical protein
MGSPIDYVSFAAFADELEKISAFDPAALLKRVIPMRMVKAVNAGKDAVFGAPGSTLQRFGGGLINALKEGFNDMTTRHSISKAIKQGPEAIAARMKPTIWGKTRVSGPGEHLLEHMDKPVPFSDIAAGNIGKHRIPTAAEELSRRGWTGEGRLTKYLPVGPKGLGIGLSGMAIPSIVHAEKPSPTGEGGVFERSLGELGGIGGIVAGSGLGLVPNTLAFLGAKHVGSRAGRILDRLRGGGTMRQAISAPSPQEAEAQLAHIQKYYGPDGTR